MRASLSGMLDSLGLPELFGVESSLRFFDATCRNVTVMSALPYPVVVGQQLDNFGGNGAETGAVPLFRRTIEACFIPRIALAPDALIVPLGVAVEALVTYAVRCGGLDRSQVLHGFPHPSTANACRKHTFEKNAPRLRDELLHRFSSHGACDYT